MKKVKQVVLDEDDLVELELLLEQIQQTCDSIDAKDFGNKVGCLIGFCKEILE